MERTLIIAEAGVNHNGDITLAYKMIDEAKAAGADVIKFQMGKPENIISKFAEKATYQKENTDAQESQLDMVKRLMFSFGDYRKLKDYCDRIDIEFLTTPFDIDSIHFINDIVNLWKIPSGEITNLPYLVEIAKTKKPIILSTGMSNIIEIKDALGILKAYGTTKISLLQCNTQYPTPYEDVNLNVIPVLKYEFGTDVGYSDHTLGIEVPIAAVAMGATIIEKHFTLDRNMEGPDHKASLEPDELKRMIDAIRNVEKAKGSEKKQVSKSEEGNIDIVRKSIVAKCDISRGEIFTEDNITTKRPGNGLSPMKWFEVLGKVAMRDFCIDEMIEI